MFGESGSGKSFLALDMGLAIARGLPTSWASPARKGPVLYQAGEGGAGLVKRMRAYRHVPRPVTTSDLPFQLLPRAGQPVRRSTTSAASQDFRGRVHRLGQHYGGLSAVFIDTLSAASRPAPTKTPPRTWAGCWRLDRDVPGHRRFGHLGSPQERAGSRERGHTSLRANLDTAMEVITRRGRQSNERCTSPRSRTVRTASGSGFALQSVQIGSYDSGKPMTSCVVVPAEEGSQPTGDKKLFLSAGSYKFLKTLEDAIYQKGGNPTSARPHPDST
jgi:hypothetical protein